MAKPTAAEVQEVFEHWVATCRNSGRGRAPVLSTKRRGKIERALRDYGMDRVKDAISGVLHSPWHQGDNPMGKKYDELELILRDETKIEKFEQLYLDHLELEDRGLGSTLDNVEILDDHRRSG